MFAKHSHRICKPRSISSYTRFIHNIVLLRGDGVGPEIVDSAVKVVESTGVPVSWKEFDYGLVCYEKTGKFCSDQVFDTFDDTRLIFKGPITIPPGDKAYAHVRGKVYTSPNQALRKAFQLYANVRPSKSIPNVSKFPNVDLVVIRENTECLYSGIERWEGETVIAERHISRMACERISRFAFEFARDNDRKRITAVHKANVLKKSDGLFLTEFDKISKAFSIQSDHHLADSLLTALVTHPETFDVLVCPNLYGDLVSDLAGGLIGSLGLCPSALIGDTHAVFEPAHGSAPDIAGRDIVNPVSQMLCAKMMLEYIGEKEAAVKVQDAIFRVLERTQDRTVDIGGELGTKAFTKAVIAEL